jgi:hypothetical protein
MFKELSSCIFLETSYSFTFSFASKAVIFPLSVNIGYSDNSI